MSKASDTRRKNKRIEAEFETEMHRGAESTGFIRIPIPDSVPPVINENRMGQRPKIYDLALYKDGLLHGIELKQTDGNLARSDFKPHQLPQLGKVYERGGFGWVGVVFHDTARRFREVWFAWSEHVRTAYLHGFDSLTIDWFAKWGVQLPKFRAPIVDPDTFNVKIYEDGEQRLGRAWDFTPAHELALGFVERKRGAA